jgi:hypothetical protein
MPSGSGLKDTIALLVSLALLCAFVLLPAGPKRKVATAPAVAAQATATPGILLRITLGLGDTEPTDWGGEIRVSEGTVRLSGAPSSGERLEDARWRLSSRRYQPVILEASLVAPGEARIQLETKNGSFGFALGDVQLGRRMVQLDGRATVERMFSAQSLTGGPTDDDFPSCASGADGNVWCVNTSYRHGSPIDETAVNQGRFDSLVTRGNGDQVRLLKFDGREWRGPWDVTEPGLDVWRPVVTVAGDGRVHVLWSAQIAGDWELYQRVFDPATNRWSDAARLTHHSGADINVAAAVSRSGRIWLAWQAWDDGRFVVRARILGEERTIARGDATPAGNEWHPAIAADSAGRVYIAFDSYATGNYDVFLWSLREDGSGSRTIPVADSPRFEARPSISIDKTDRVWIAFEDADPNWGKDFGKRWKGVSGVPFYGDRRIVVRCWHGGRLEQTMGELLPERLDTFRRAGSRGAPNTPSLRVSFPRLIHDRGDRPWLLYRRHPNPMGVGELWTSYASYYEGDRWSGPVPLQRSENLLDNRPALCRAGNGILAVFAGDGRSGSRGSAVRNDLYSTRLDVAGAPEAPIFTAIPSPQKVGPVHATEAEDIRRIHAYRTTAGNRTYRLLRGEFHRHTEISSHSDQDGPLEEIWRYGLDVARMDWIGPGDHDSGGGKEYTWWLTQKQIAMYYQPPVFLPMFTYERSVAYPSGHRNVIFARRGIRALPRLSSPDQKDILYGSEDSGSPDIKNLYAYLRHFDGICSSHTSATEMGTDWRDNAGDVEPVVEIFQGARQSYEEPNAPMAATDAADSIGGYQPAGYVWNAFAKGYKLGFQVSSDHVSTHISYGVVFAERTDRAAILDAFKKRHSYGANDNIILDVRCGDHIMGDEFPVDAPPKFEITVEGTNEIARIDVVRQKGRDKPAYVYSWEPKRRSARLSWSDAQAARGERSMYYFRVRQVDGAMAWASPMWVDYR